MEKHVTSLQLSQRLKALRIERESLFIWQQSTTGNWYVNDRKLFDWGSEWYPAYLASELTEIMPPGYHASKLKDITHGDTWKETHEYICTSPYSEIQGLEPGKFRAKADTLPDALGKMLIYLIENNLITLAGVQP